MHIGFTGTRKGLTFLQQKHLEEVLTSLIVCRPRPHQAHHGDCIGADAVFHRMCREAGLPVTLHPPVDGGQRAWCQGAAEELAPLPYLQRNRAIVTVSDVLIACPGEARMQLRSGTWATIRYANKAELPLVTILPSGQVIRARTERLGQR